MAEKRGEGLQKFEIPPGETGEQPIRPEVVEQTDILPSEGEIALPQPEIALSPEQTHASPEVSDADVTEKTEFRKMPSPPKFPDELEDSLTWGDH
ncbi:MAG: hypothetical protein Q7K33_01025 [Candidatus Berkelbacteria bacterium]|nr:hypothetical protein [Candidatus Berkelbacteria bacterium]